MADSARGGGKSQHQKAGRASQQKGGHKLTTADRSKGGRVSSSKQNMSKLGEIGARKRWGNRTQND